ncbi:hypothetical protein F66182_845 [Fusarium sp. NRRL 66182]|nr:hypothetical protein F66182_845 [Fusarium sp. NRRL 66182]
MTETLFSTPALSPTPSRSSLARAAYNFEKYKEHKALMARHDKFTTEDLVRVARKEEEDAAGVSFEERLQHARATVASEAVTTTTTDPAEGPEVSAEPQASVDNPENLPIEMIRPPIDNHANQDPTEPDDPIYDFRDLAVIASGDSYWLKPLWCVPPRLSPFPQAQPNDAQYDTQHDAEI